MSILALNSFLKALETVKQDLTCAFCKELCVSPITLSKCFHIICGVHFDMLQNCPVCDISLDGCKTYIDDSLTTAVVSTKKLDEIFELYKQKENIPLSDVATSKELNKKRRVMKIKETTKTKKPKSVNTDTKSVAESIENITKKPKSQTNKSTKDSLNTTNLSSKFNKTVEKMNNKGETCLHVACRLGKVDKVIELLQEGANINTKDNAGWTPLHEVVQNGRLDLVSLLLQHSALVNVPGPSNETPLHEAVRYNHKDIVKELIINGADVTLRNIKGDTPLDLASDEMRQIIDDARENIQQTQSLNLTRISEVHMEQDYDDIRVYCISQFRTVQNKLKSLVKHHENLHIETTFTKKVTHLIVDTEDDLICLSSLDTLQAIVNELWIISSIWVNHSNNDTLAQFNKFEVKGIGKSSHNGPKNARYNKYKQWPRLFNGCHFYFHNFNTKYEITKNLILNKTILSKLVQDGGGVVLRRVPNPESIPESENLVPYHAAKNGKLVDCSHYIIFKDMYQPMYNMKHLKALPVGWLIDCIEKYQLVDP